MIEEIEEMMQESPDPEDDETPTQSDRLSVLSQEIQTLKRSSTSSYEESKKPDLNQYSLCFCIPQPCSGTISRSLWLSQAVLYTLPLPSRGRVYIIYAPAYSGHIFIIAQGLCHTHL